MVRISGDESVKGQLRKTKDGRLECDFPDRMVMIANHQVRRDIILYDMLLTLETALY
jgi:lysocardiolipin and lysophospholipid acyltransferase